MAETNDPRVFFAAERTLLAWFRTGLAVMGLGFVVARFGMFLRMMRGADPSPMSGSGLIGVVLIGLGALAVGAASYQHHRFLRKLEPRDRPVDYWTWLGVAWGVVLCLTGIVLAAYLLLGSHGGGVATVMTRG